MKVLVTGGAGFIGFHLARRLANEDNEVIICDNFSRGRADKDWRILQGHPNVDIINHDLTIPTNILALDYDIIYHLAAVNGTKNFYERPHEVLRTNVLSLINILDWMLASTCKQLVWTSSSETYSGTLDIPIPTPEKVALTIADISNPRFSYAGSKIIGEQFCLHYAKAYNLDISIVRPHNVYGPRMGYDHVIPEIFTRIMRKEDPFKIYGEEQTRAFCYIDDFVSGVQLVAEEKDIGIVNIGDDSEEIRIDNLVLKMFDITGFHPNKLLALPAPTGSVNRRCPDISKVREVTGYTPKIDLDTGLRLTYEWYHKHNND